MNKPAQEAGQVGRPTQPAPTCTLKEPPQGYGDTAFDGNDGAGDSSGKSARRYPSTGAVPIVALAARYTSAQGGAA